MTKSSLLKRVEKLEAQMKPSVLWFATLIPGDPATGTPDMYETNGLTLTREELEAFCEKHQITRLLIWDLPCPKMT